VRKSTEEKLDELDRLPAEGKANAFARLETALADRHFSVVAKAAKLAAEGLHYELCPKLAAAYRRLLDKPAKSDPSCIAKKALVRSLVELDYGDVDFYLDGLRYTQMEPVWGGTVDTATEVRTSCAMGLVATGYTRALVELIALLNDAEAPARAGAVRAIACGNRREAELLLRAKVQAGDPEPAVLGECFVALLSVEPDESLPFVARYLTSGDYALREHAALALGESRLDAALPLLEAAWDEPVLSAEFRGALLRGAALLRSDAAFDWLIEIAGTRDARAAAQVIESLALYRQNAKLAARLGAALAERNDAALLRQFRERWEK
jgi:hypothetical protein